MSNETSKGHSGNHSATGHNSARRIKLVRNVSILSPLAILALMIALSIQLGEHLEHSLIDRDRIIAGVTIQVEAEEALEGRKFSAAYTNEKVREDILAMVMGLPGATRLAMYNMEGQLAWTSDGQKPKRNRSSGAFELALSGITSSEESLEEEEESWFEELEFLSSIYVPVKQNEMVVGVFQIERSDTELFEAIKSMTFTVKIYCLIFGVLLYMLLLLIVVPAAKRMDAQNADLIAANEELAATRDELVQKERLSAVGEVCGAVAHGLKNPLASLRSAVQLMSLRKMEESERQDLLKDILAEVDRLTKRLNDLLNFIRPFQPDPDYVKLHEVLANTLRGLQWKAEAEGVKLKLTADPNLPSINVDSALMEEALLILVGNALDASLAGGSVECAVVGDGNLQTVTVTDTGTGISPDILPRVFDQFFTTRSQGVGLGLALCRKIMKIHGGDVTLESTPGEQTVATMSLPVGYLAQPDRTV